MVDGGHNLAERGPKQETGHPSDQSSFQMQLCHAAFQWPRPAGSGQTQLWSPASNGGAAVTVRLRSGGAGFGDCHLAWMLGVLNPAGPGQKAVLMRRTFGRSRGPRGLVKHEMRLAGCWMLGTLLVQLVISMRQDNSVEPAAWRRHEREKQGSGDSSRPPRVLVLELEIARPWPRRTGSQGEFKPGSRTQSSGTGPRRGESNRSDPRAHRLPGSTASRNQNQPTPGVANLFSACGICSRLQRRFSSDDPAIGG